MAITYDNSATGVADAHTCSTSSFAVANNPDRILIALVGIGDVSDTIASVVWNTTESFTQAGTVTDSDDQQADIWYLVNPTAATSVVTSTATASQTPDTSITAISLYNVAQTSSVLNFSSSTGNSTTPSLNITVSNNGSWVVDILAVEDTSKTYTAGADQVERSDFVGGSGAGLFTNATSTKPVASAGANSTSWTIPTGAELWVMASVEIKATTGTNVNIGVSSLTTTSPATTIKYGYVKSMGISSLIIASPISVATTVGSTIIKISSLNITNPGRVIIYFSPVRTTSYTENSGEVTSWSEKTPTASSWAEGSRSTSWNEITPTSTTWN